VKGSPSLILGEPCWATEGSAATIENGRKREAMEEPRRSWKKERLFIA
jgi:hypothetical protein